MADAIACLAVAGIVAAAVNRAVAATAAAKGPRPRWKRRRLQKLPPPDRKPERVRQIDRTDTIVRSGLVDEDRTGLRVGRWPRATAADVGTNKLVEGSGWFQPLLSIDLQ
jgi:hypothetical protein